MVFGVHEPMVPADDWTMIKTLGMQQGMFATRVPFMGAARTTNIVIGIGDGLSACIVLCDLQHRA